MPKRQNSQDEFIAFKKQYGDILEKFLNDATSSKALLNEGNKLGREALEKHIAILNVTAIHQDCLLTYLEKLETNQHLKFSKKANAFFEEILASFQMISAEFREAITLLNLRTLEYARRVRALKESVQEKEALLKEVYHRVKNNLQVVSSLLNLQAESEKGTISKDVLIESSARVRSMALIHEMLYRSGDLSKIEMATYVQNLTNYLKEIYHKESSNVALSITIDDILLTIAEAIPCGLIINELISNAYKHAFPSGREGEIQITMKKKKSQYTLVIHDDGCGVPTDFDFNHAKRLGMQLVHRLTKQLSGTIKLDSKKGTAFTLTFSKPHNG
jgi:two-component sensor histidine kinase